MSQQRAQKGSDQYRKKLRDLGPSLVPPLAQALERRSKVDAQLAEELTQLVFVELDRKAAGLVGHPAMAGWLCTCVRWMAANARRAEYRRQRRQIEYHAMSELHSSESPESIWQHVRSVLDDALPELGQRDRTAILLRYFEDLSLKQIGMQLGVAAATPRGCQ